MRSEPTVLTASPSVTTLTCISGGSAPAQHAPISFDTQCPLSLEGHHRATCYGRLFPLRPNEDSVANDSSVSVMRNGIDHLQLLIG